MELNIIGPFGERITHTVIPAADQVKGDIKDMVYQTAGISSILSSPTPDQVEGDIKDMVYQIAGIAFFIRMRFPIKLGMTVF